MNVVMQVAWVALGGALGAVARFGTSSLCAHVGWDRNFPASTFIVNGVGCFLIGLVTAQIAAHLHEPSGRIAVAFVVTGFLGGLTTFSAFAWQSRELLTREYYWLFALNVGGSVLVGLGAVVAGSAVGAALGRVE